MLVICANTLIAHLLTERLLDSAHDGDYKLMQQALAAVMGDAQDEVISRAEIIAAMPEVRAALADRDRPKLLGACRQMWETQAQKYDVDQAQFHVPPGVSFLRLDKPDVFGDDQTTARPMLADVHHGKILKKGIAVSKGGPAFFGIVPIVDPSGKLVGSFEMGLDVAPELDRIKQAFGLEAVLFFDEKQLRDVATDVPADVLSPKNRVGRFIRLHATHPDVSKALVTDEDIDVSGPKSYEREANGVVWGVQLVPLYDYANKQIGVVGLASNFGDEHMLARRALVWKLLAALVGIVICAGTILVVIRGVVLAPLASLNERIAALVGGDTTRAADPTESYCAELRALAESYERLREQKRRS